jgi:UDP-N-acetylmuramoyl-L-alanyl-D-glutamate--2,6-diaminopimelate ligase
METAVKHLSRSMCKEAIMRHGIKRSNIVAANSSFVNCADPPPLASSSSTSSATKLVSLREVLVGSRFFSGEDVLFSSVAESSEVADEGQLVVYRIGKDCPSKVVADAMSRGAAGILTEQILPCPLPQCIVGDIELAMATLTAERLGRPDRKLLSVGVIGSSGKTTTSLLVSSLLRSCGIRTAYQTDLGECDGIVQSTPSQSLPVNAPLVQWMGEANDSECRAAIIELTDEDARRGHYDAIEFDILIVTGSATCTGDYGPSGLQCVLERLARGGVVVAPVDDTRAMQVIDDAGAKLVTYGIRKASDVSAKIMDQSDGMTTLLITYQDTSAVMETSLCGAAMAANLAAAVLVGLLVAQPLQEIVEKLCQLRSVPGRGQRLESFGQAAVVLDAGGSPERATSALRTFRSMKSAGRLWCVLAINGNDSPEQLAQYGTQLERFADNAILTSKLGAKSTFLAASHAVLDGIEKCAAFRLVADRRRAIEWAVSEAGPLDTILVITGQQKQTAAEHRTDIERISGWVSAARELNEKPDGSNSDRPQLSIFG